MPSKWRRFNKEKAAIKPAQPLLDYKNTEKYSFKE